MECDVLIIGGGQAAPPLVQALDEAGRSVVLAERRHLGGSCVNFGCTPTKAAIASAKLAHQARRAADYGLAISGLDVDFEAVLARARGMAESGRRSLEEMFAENGNPRLVRGHARLVGREGERILAEIEGERFAARDVVLDTGTRTKVPPIDGLEEVPYLNAGNWLDGRELPRHLAVIGGSYIGLEMAQLYRRLGSEAIVIERGPRILEREDEDVAGTLQQLLVGEGIGFRLETGVKAVERVGEDLRLHLDGNGTAGPVDASHLFIATGRKPNTDDLGLDAVGVEHDDEGFVTVDERLATSCPGVWAAGDIRGGPMFTHTSWDDSRVLHSQLLGNGQRTTRRIAPYAVFTDPQLGRVGMTESEARESGRNIRVARFDMASNGKAREIGEPDGMIKVVTDADTDRLLGAAVLSAEGAELVHLYIDLMNANAPVQAIVDAVHIHPTLAEAAQSALASLR